MSSKDGGFEIERHHKCNKSFSELPFKTREEMTPEDIAYYYALTLCIYGEKSRKNVIELLVESHKKLKNERIYRITYYSNLPRWKKIILDILDIKLVG